MAGLRPIVEFMTWNFSMQVCIMCVCVCLCVNVNAWGGICLYLCSYVALIVCHFVAVLRIYASTCAFVYVRMRACACAYVCV